jgi:hypothetical protein
MLRQHVHHAIPAGIQTPIAQIGPSHLFAKRATRGHDVPTGSDHGHLQESGDVL